MASTPAGKGGRVRRFSKTQRGLNFDENVDAVVINNWVSQCLNGTLLTNNGREYGTTVGLLPMQHSSSVVPAPALR